MLNDSSEAFRGDDPRTYYEFRRQTSGKSTPRESLFNDAPEVGPAAAEDSFKAFKQEDAV